MSTTNSCKKISHHEVFLVGKSIETISITQFPTKKTVFITITEILY